MSANFLVFGADGISGQPLHMHYSPSLVHNTLLAEAVHFESSPMHMQGRSVAEAINAFQPAERDVQRPLRMPIVEVFKGGRGAICISGKIEAGAMKVRLPIRFGGSCPGLRIPCMAQPFGQDSEITCSFQIHLVTVNTKNELF